MREAELRVLLMGIASSQGRIEAKLEQTKELEEDFERHIESNDAHGMGGAKWMFRIILTIVGLVIAGGGLFLKASGG